MRASRVASCDVPGVTPYDVRDEHGVDAWRGDADVRASAAEKKGWELLLGDVGAAQRAAEGGGDGER